jgi:DNA-binding transcriptional LysR family regulator
LHYLGYLYNQTMSLPRYTLRQLDAFVRVADALSFTAAARQLALTSSAVSQLVIELESGLDFKLFERSTRKVVLSAAGKEFYSSVMTLLKHVRMVDVAASDLRNRAAGLVRIAAPMVIASSILPPIIKDYSQSRPKIVVRIRDASVEQLTDLVANGEVDLAIGPDRQHADEVLSVGLFNSPWVLWCAERHPLASKRTLYWKDLRCHALVTAGRDHELSVAQMGAGLPEGERISPHEVVDHISTAIGLAASGLAATLAPAYIAPWAKQQGLVMRRILKPEVMRQVCLYRPTHRIASPATEGFAEYLTGRLKTPK